MAGKCKYCGFFGTQDEIVDHAGSCPIMLEDCQPDIAEETRHIHQQAQHKITPSCKWGLDICPFDVAHKQCSTCWCDKTA